MTGSTANKGSSPEWEPNKIMPISTVRFPDGASLAWSSEGTDQVKWTGTFITLLNQSSKAFIRHSSFVLHKTDTKEGKHEIILEKKMGTATFLDSCKRLNYLSTYIPVPFLFHLPISWLKPSPGSKKINHPVHGVPNLFFIAKSVKLRLKSVASGQLGTLIKSSTMLRSGVYTSQQST